MRHIVFVVADYNPAVGGTTTQTRLQAQEMLRRGCRVTVLTQRLEAVWPRLEVLEGIQVRRFGSPRSWLGLRSTRTVGIWRWLLLNRADIETVHVVMDSDLLVASWAAGLSRRTVFTWATRGDALRMLGPAKLGDFRRGVVRGLLRRAMRSIRRRALAASANVVLTPKMAREIEELGLTCASVIPVPVDENKFRPGTDEERAAGRIELGLGRSTTIVFTGHLERRKAVDRLLEAYISMIEEGLDTRLLLVGGGQGDEHSNLEPALREIVRQKELRQLVTITGAVADVRPYLWASDIFVLPSYREGMPNSLLEAMACGLPCVAPASAGGDEVLADGAGVVPASNSPKDLVDAIRPLVNDPLARRDIGVVAQTVARTWSPSAVMDDYEHLYGHRRRGSHCRES